MSAFAELRAVKVFEDLSDDDLAWLAETGEILSLPAGAAVVREGDPADVMIAVMEGELRAARETPPADGRVYVVKAGMVSGMLPFSRLKIFPVTSRAVVPTRLLRFPAARFPEMLQRIPVLEPRLITTMADRVRDQTREEHKRETLMALGKLSAGLAHELNNPAAAARRASSELGERLALLPRLFAELLAARLEPDECDAVDRLLARVMERAHAAPEGALFRADREDELIDWFADRGVEDPERLAGTFVERGLRVADLEALSTSLSAAALPAALAWAEALAAADGLAADIQAATTRVSDLVAAVKSYSHMDQAPALAETDLRESLETTLTILAHKLREKGITLSRSFAPDLPRVPAFGGELNQVWTNLIDNAMDAVSRGGRIAVRALREHDHVLVEITDDGPGIPEEILPRIFEPFFTTKPVGQGTGLGLDIAHRIVTRRHNGELRVDSRPGETRFQVRLPLGDGTKA
jgi:signal transduction histidine kinase